jgi:hypothetical protein
MGGGPLSCPRCGGEARSPIAPGYWRCESLVTWEQPDRRGWAIPERVTGTCGNAYQEAVPGTGGAPACSCGTDSIGNCSNCGRRVCGIHSRLFHSARVCDTCMPAAQQRRKQEEADKAAAYAARLATLPSMGAGQFAAFCRAWAAFAGGGDDLERMQAVREGQLPDDGGYVLRPLQGKVIARALAELKVATYTDEIRKWYSDKWRPHEDLGWQIWQRSIIDLSASSSDSVSYCGSPPDYPRFCMDGDGTVRELTSRYGGSQSRPRYAGSTVVRVIPADTYWSMTVLRHIANYVRSYPGAPLRVEGQNPQEQLYADRADAWAHPS